MNENENKESEMDYSHQNQNSILGSKSKREKLAKFIKEYYINPTDVMEVALTAMEEVKSKVEANKEKPKKAEPKKEKPNIWDNEDVGTLTCSVMDDVPNLDIYKCAMVAELDMMKMSGLLDEEDKQELKRLKGEVSIEKIALDEYWKRSFGGEKKSNDSRH